jgi:chromosome segregation ATPase
MMSDEELAALQDRLAEAEAEVERLQTTAADGEARAAHLEEILTQSRTELASRDVELAALTDSLSTALEADELREGCGPRPRVPPGGVGQPASPPTCER